MRSDGKNEMKRIDQQLVYIVKIFKFKFYIKFLRFIYQGMYRSYRVGDCRFYIDCVTYASFHFFQKTILCISIICVI